MTQSEILIGSYLMSNIEILFVSVVLALLFRAIVRSFDKR